MANDKKPVTTRNRRTPREVLSDSLAKAELDIETYEARLTKAKATQKDAKKQLSALNAAERANAATQIAHHEAELARLHALVGDSAAVEPDQG
jgi:septal ring factor EnvC (AmiA/AmiB activator)